MKKKEEGGDGQRHSELPLCERGHEPLRNLGGI